MHNKRTLKLVQFSLLLALEAIVCFTPLGSLPIGPLVATLMHIPVIITALTLGVGAGSLMGFFGGLFSFIVWTFMPPSPVLAFVFTPLYNVGDVHGNIWSVVICFVPRILIGTLSGLTFIGLKKLFTKFDKHAIAAYSISGLAGSLANTILVLGGIYIFFGVPYAAANGLAYEALLGAIIAVIFSNGLLEAGVAVVAALAICKPINIYLNKAKN